MYLWRLSPIDPADPNWEASSYRGVAVVRARDEAGARKAAETAFGVKTRFPPGHGVTAPPWLRPASVKAEIIEDSRYQSDGPTEVVFPPP
ncbi:MAG TPA: hypothetical protein VGB88_13635 [Alphaproteobacteria bacterium]